MPYFLLLSSPCHKACYSFEKWYPSLQCSVCVSRSPATMQHCAPPPEHSQAIVRAESNFKTQKLQNRPSLRPASGWLNDDAFSECICSGHQKIWLFNPIVICMSPGSKLLSLVSLCVSGPAWVLLLGYALRAQKQSTELRTVVHVVWCSGCPLAVAPESRSLLTFRSKVRTNKDATR